MKKLPGKLNGNTALWAGLVIAMAAAAFTITAQPQEPPSEQSEQIFKDGFENGDASKWGNGGGPKVVWQPESIMRTIGIGDRVSITVSLNIRQDLPPTTLWLTPSLQNIVSVNPSTLPALSAGTEVPVRLTLSPEDLGEIEGTLHVRASEGPPRTFAKPLPIVMIGAEESPLPPEPDPEENDSSLEGVDSNNDGVRDDVERFIEQGWTDPVDKAALRQYAKALQLIYNESTYDQANTALTRARICLQSTRGAFDAADYDSYKALSRSAVDALKKVRAELVNTEDRLRAYFSYNSSRSGTVTQIPVLSNEQCDFNLEELQ